MGLPRVDVGESLRGDVASLARYPDADDDARRLRLAEGPVERRLDGRAPGLGNGVSDEPISAPWAAPPANDNRIVMRKAAAALTRVASITRADPLSGRWEWCSSQTACRRGNSHTRARSGGS